MTPTIPPPTRETFHIKLRKEGKIPNYRPWRTSAFEDEELRRQIEVAIGKGWISPSTSEFALPVLFVPKKDGKLRMCIDYRGLNATTIKDRYPIPNIEDLLDKLTGASWFTKLDMASGYHQFAVAAKDRPKTAFVTKFGNFEWNVVPFGLCNRPSFFMHMMTKLLAKDPVLQTFCAVYLDDILIFSKSKAEHIAHVKRILQILRAEQFRLQPSKCEFFTRDVEFCGFWVDGAGIHTEQVKVAAVRDWSTPTIPREVKGFLGLTGYYRKFIHHYAHKALPLNEVALRPKEEFQWTPVEEAAFKTLKKAITSAPVLATPIKGGHFSLRTDCSKFAMGAVLMQEQGQGHGDVVIRYFSRKLKGVETRYPTYDRELLAIKDAVLHFRYYMHGQSFTIYTDHASIQHVLLQRTLSSCQVGLLDTMNHFHYEIKYWPGTRNQVADALSRRPDYRDEEVDLRTMACSAREEEVDLRAMEYAISAGAEWRMEVASRYLEDPYFGPVVKLLAREWDLVRERKDASVVELSKEFEPLVLQRRKRFWMEDDGLLFTRHWPQDDSPRENDAVLCVPRGGNLRYQLFHECHDTELGGHFGADRTYELLAERFFWPRILPSVKSYVKSYDTCQRTKPGRTTPRPLIMLPVPHDRWSRIGIDFITKLPTTGGGNDCIATIINHFTKRVHWFPMKESTST